MTFSRGDRIWVVNSRSNGISPGFIASVVPDGSVVVRNERTESYQVFDSTTGEAIGDRWGDERPRIADESDLVVSHLLWTIRNTEFGEDVHRRVNDFKLSGSVSDYEALQEEIREWAVFQFEKKD